MPFDELLVHVIKGYRRAANSVDRYGIATEAAISGTPHYTGICRVTVPMGGKVNNERNDEVFENTYAMVFIPANADIREDDLIHVEDRTGNVLVQSGRVQQRNEYTGGGNAMHHSVLTVWEQAGPTAGPGN